jgi:hypothetical protein
MSKEKQSVEITREVLIDVYKKLEEKHRGHVISNVVSASDGSDMPEVKYIQIGSETFVESPWTLLMELIYHFLASYLRDGKVKFKFMYFRRNFQTVVKLIRFIKSVKKMF